MDFIAIYNSSLLCFFLCSLLPPQRKYCLILSDLRGSEFKCGLFVNIYVFSLNSLFKTTKSKSNVLNLIKGVVMCVTSITVTSYGTEEVK